MTPLGIEHVEVRTEVERVDGESEKRKENIVSLRMILAFLHDLIS